MPGLSVHYCVSDLHRVRKKPDSDPDAQAEALPDQTDSTNQARVCDVGGAAVEQPFIKLSQEEYGEHHSSIMHCRCGQASLHTAVHSQLSRCNLGFYVHVVFLGWTAPAGEWPVWMWTGWWRFGPSIPSCKPKPLSCPSPRCSLWSGQPSPTDW